MLRAWEGINMCTSVQVCYTCTVDWEIFAFKYFRVINVCVSNFRHKVQEVKIKHCVFYFCVLNFRRPPERRKYFNGEYFPIYGISTDDIVNTTHIIILKQTPECLFLEQLQVPDIYSR